MYTVHLCFFLICPGLRVPYVFNRKMRITCTQYTYVFCKFVPVYVCPMCLIEKYFRNFMCKLNICFSNLSRSTSALCWSLSSGFPTKTLYTLCSYCLVYVFLLYVYVSSSCHLPLFGYPD